MTTPYQNSVGVTSFNPTLLGAGRYVAHGEKWGGALGTGLTLDFSFLNSVTSRYAQSYSGYNEYNASNQLSSGEKTAVRAALAVWSSFANVSFHEVTDSTTVAGDLRFGYTTLNSGNEAAHAYYPATYPAAGDVWFDWDNFNPNGLASIARGSYDFLTILHEIGHALGLKHPFETPNAMPAALDNHFYSIMSYTASPYSTHGDNYASFHPTTPMYYDLLAIEGMYGQRAYATGNNNYVFNDGVRYWQAINDTAGNDTITYHGVENAVINLSPGTFSAVSERIDFNGGSSKATVTIGPHVLIENAVGGNGNDQLIGNGIGNGLNGGAGNDTLFGASGNDYMVGGSGNDRLYGSLGNDYLIGGAGNDLFAFNSAPNALTNRDKVADYNPVQDTILLENAIFSRLPVSAHMNVAYFRAAAHALDRNDFVVYNRATGLLLYDPNGNAAGGEMQVAVLSTRPVLTASEFMIV